eukprot:188737_1
MVILVYSGVSHYGDTFYVFPFTPETFFSGLPRKDLYNSNDCKMNDEYEQLQLKNTLSATVMGTMKGKSVRGGMVSKAITNALKKNYVDNNYRHFKDVCKMAETYISMATNDAQSLNSEFCSVDIYDIVFKPNSGKRGYGDYDEDSQESELTQVNRIVNDVCE